MAAPTTKGTHTTQAKTLIFIALLVFRIINSQLVQTFFQPDEYFQALEPAWQLAFGPHSGAWITWEWTEGLRTSVHPYLFAAAYKAVARICELVQANEQFRAAALGAAPRLLQAFWAAVMDLLTWRMASIVYGPGHVATSAALVLTALSPWQWFCSIRTFSNSLEATLTICSLCYFPWAWFLDCSSNKARSGKGVVGSLHGLYAALTAAAAAFYLRPTNIIIWVSISVCLMWYNRSLQKAATLVGAAAMVGSTIAITFASADRAYYGEWTFPPIRFLQFNIIQSLAVFYGRNRSDYYISEGLPLLLTTALPFALVGIYLSLSGTQLSTTQNVAQRRTASVFAATIITTVLSLSVIAHKEVRFIYPLLPMLHILAARPLAYVFSTRKPTRPLILAIGIAINIYIAYYVSFVHQRGVIEVMHYLRRRQVSWFDASRADKLAEQESANITVGFLMPCHSTPWRSHLIYPEITAWALTCEPPIHLSMEERSSYLDEADIFYQDPSKWLADNMQDRVRISLAVDPYVEVTTSQDISTRRAWPHYLVAFEQLQPTVAPILYGTRYKVCRRFFNTHWHDDRRRAGDVIVWCMRR